VQADEVTYDLHILIRFELERALLSGDLRAGEPPGAWAEMYQRYTGGDLVQRATGSAPDPSALIASLSRRYRSAE